MMGREWMVENCVDFLKISQVSRYRELNKSRCRVKGIVMNEREWGKIVVGDKERKFLKSL